MKILFVCTGNTCRSPMAAAIAASMYPSHDFDSAGISVYFPSEASTNAVCAAKKYGGDLSSHMSKQVSVELLDSADTIFTMTAYHKEALISMSPAHSFKIMTLSDTDICDPFGGDLPVYEKCATQIYNCIVALKLQQALPNQPQGGEQMAKLHVIDHPLIKNKISMLRSIETGNKEFREIVEEVATLICYEATRDVPTVEVDIETPICVTKGRIIEQKFGIVPILRAGIGMVSGMLNLMPTAKVGHIGIYRDPETLKPVEYYCKLPTDANERDIFLIDPMLATGGTASYAIDYLKQRGVKRIKLLCLLAAPEGVARINKDHPDVDIYTSEYDERLNDHGYIVPGLGDAGDRLFGTK